MNNAEITPTEFEQRNIAKYGDKTDDTIARTYRENAKFGDVYCAKNAEKYLRRFVSNSEKGNNITDLRKAVDYVNRMIEFHESQPKQNTTEVIE